jgi:enediyne biosynthesis protein E4
MPNAFGGVVNVNPGPSRIRRAATLLVALVVVGTLYLLSQLPTLSSTEADAIAARFRFEKLPFPELAGFPHQTVRQVHPSLAHLSAYISALGASVALGDIDGDGLPNDLCYVDPRIDQVVIAPAPGTPQDRYEPFVLQPGPLAYDRAMAPTGCLLGDFNEDGLTDVLVLFWGRSPIIYLQQPAAESGKRLTAHTFVPCELIEPWQRWFSCTATQADLDGDGHCDLVIGNYAPDGADYLDPNGSGRLPMTESLSRSFNGGGPHFFLWKKPGSDKTPFIQFEKVDPDFLFPEKVDPRRMHEVSHGWTLALGAADLDGDGLPEVYVANDFGPDRLLHNRSVPGKLRFALLEGERGFTTPRSRVLGQDSFKGMGIDFGDVNGDGWLDMYVSNISAPYSLFESHFLWLSTGQVERMKHGIAPYYDAGEELGLSRSGWGWDSRLADFDNDGVLEAVQAMGFLKGTTNRWPEMHELGATNDQLLSDPRFWPDFRPGADFSGSDHDRFFVRAADGRFYDLSHRLGLSTPMVTRGIALADVDGDGRLDFAVANQWQPSFLFRNTAPHPGAFLGLHLRLPVGPQTSDKTVVLKGHPPADKPSRPAIGAAVTVHLPDGRRLVSQVDGGSGHSGKRAPDVHLGLGNVEAGALLNVDVRWRGADGKMRSQTLQLTSGWHTVWLGLEASEGG